MKSESDLTKLARWVIPGWVAILSFFGFTIIDTLFTQPTRQPYLFQSLTDLFAPMPDTNTIIAALFVAAAGVPLGFTIYQAYFFLRWNSPFSRDGLLPPLLPGRLIDLEKSWKGIHPNEAAGSMEWRKMWVNDPLFEQDYGFKWRYVELLFLEAAQKIDSTFEGVSIYARHRYLHEIVHTLGASIGAVYIGFIGYVFEKVKLEQISLPPYLITLLLFTLPLFPFLRSEESAKRLPKQKDEKSDPAGYNQKPAMRLSFKILRRGNRSPRLVVVSPGSLYIFTLGLILFFNSPTLNPFPSLQDTILRSLAVLAVIFVWLRSKKSSPKAVMYGDACSLSLSLFLGNCLPSCE